MRWPRPGSAVACAGVPWQVDSIYIHAQDAGKHAKKIVSALSGLGLPPPGRLFRYCRYSRIRHTDTHAPPALLKA